MGRIYNFSAGPATLPEAVLQEAAEEMLDYRGTGMSVMEMSHRSKAYEEIHNEAIADLRELRSIYGDEADSFPTGAIGVFSYLNKIHLGVRQFLALNRKFDVAYTDRTDLIPLTYEALDLLNGTYLK